MLIIIYIKYAFKKKKCNVGVSLLRIDIINNYINMLVLVLFLLYIWTLVYYSFAFAYMW